jgi:hypothetical protein
MQNLGVMVVCVNVLSNTLKIEAAGFSEKCCISTRLHSVRFQKTVIFIDTALKTYDKYRGNSSETDDSQFSYTVISL